MIAAQGREGYRKRRMSDETLLIDGAQATTERCVNADEPDLRPRCCST